MAEGTSTPVEQDGSDAERTVPPASDRSTRQAAIWATVVALPLTVLVAIFAFGKLAPTPDAASANPTPSATTPRVQSTAPVTMSAVPLAERPATVCRALLSRLPATLGELAQRPVSAGPEQNAAYGDPAVAVSCGSPLPSFPPTDQVWVVNAVCWHAQEESDQTVFVTVDREVPVRVAVPRGYDPPLQWIAPLAESVVAAVPSSATKPYGCTA
ncbi:uncharacterized protein DUF3515 [Micromonospora pisi]|uniref:Uncharacterized protein DUF3515 n=1 Tax=Micromonospora pisi TaxID=589240 RepID=A0A495JP15_9ACTN|nr:DUF3515 family protein [Micromonospora pisi]RKR90693.1 uncharacterized protein DUF3515 [Micromonospora pisi]